MAEDQNRTLQDKFMLRLPDGLRDRIKASADNNNRSMNAEIVATLEDAYPQGMTIADILAIYSDRIDQAKADEELRAIEKEINDISLREQAGYIIKLRIPSPEQENEPIIAFYPIHNDDKDPA